MWHIFYVSRSNKPEIKISQISSLYDENINWKRPQITAISPPIEKNPALEFHGVPKFWPGAYKQPFLRTRSEHTAKRHSMCCQVDKISFLLHEVDAAEKDGNSSFRTGNRNTAISAYAQLNMVESTRKRASIDKITLSFRKLGSRN